MERSNYCNLFVNRNRKRTLCFAGCSQIQINISPCYQHFLIVSVDPSYARSERTEQTVIESAQVVDQLKSKCCWNMPGYSQATGGMCPAVGLHPKIQKCLGKTSSFSFFEIGVLTLRRIAFMLKQVLSSFLAWDLLLLKLFAFLCQS